MAKPSYPPKGPSEATSSFLPTFPEGSVLDLYGHYQHRFAHEPDAPYIAHDALCKTNEKFGQAIQDRLEIIVKIQRSTSTSA